MKRSTTRWMAHFAVSMLAMAAGCAGGEGEVSGEIEEVRVEGTEGEVAALPQAELERARQTATALGQDLAGMVFSTMEEEGPAAAVRICSEVAQERTAAHALDGVYVRRISDRLRNPLNAPDAAEAAELERLHAIMASGAAPPEIVRVVRDGGDRYLHLMRPIVIQPACLTCHGDPETIPVEVRQILDERYPADRAVGYEAGDLRGAISVRVPIAEAGP